MSDNVLERVRLSFEMEYFLHTRFKEHRGVDDMWYACPKHPEYEGPESSDPICHCGKDRADELLAELRQACPTCRNEEEGGPPHFASPRCESGKRNHCTCSACF